MKRREELEILRLKLEEKMAAEERERDQEFRTTMSEMMRMMTPYMAQSYFTPYSMEFQPGPSQPIPLGFQPGPSLPIPPGFQPGPSQPILPGFQPGPSQPIPPGFLPNGP